MPVNSFENGACLPDFLVKEQRKHLLFVPVRLMSPPQGQRQPTPAPLRTPSQAVRTLVADASSQAGTPAVLRIGAQTVSASPPQCPSGHGKETEITFVSARQYLGVTRCTLGVGRFRRNCFPALAGRSSGIRLERGMQCMI